MKTSKSLIFIALLSVFALLAAACTGNTGNIPQPSGSDTLPSGTASDTGSSITGAPPTEETPSGTEAPVTGTEPGSDTIADVTTVPASTSIEPPPETTPGPAPETTAEPAHETTAAPQPETTAEPESGTTAMPQPEVTTTHDTETTPSETEATSSPEVSTTEPTVETTSEPSQETTTPTDTTSASETTIIDDQTFPALRPDSDIDWSQAVDGIYFKVINAPHCLAYVAIIKDPSRVYTATSSNFKSDMLGIRFWDLAERDNTVLMINAGEYPDNGGGGNGSIPVGITYSRGECVWDDDMSRTFMGFDKDNRLVLCEGLTRAQADALGIRDGVCFQHNNILVQKEGNQVVANRRGDTAISQRTAIGQREDGSVIFLVTDGRTAASPGASYNDVIDIMLRFGAVNAGMLDGGSSSTLYYRDYYNIYNYDISKLDKYQKMGLVNKYKAFTEPRRIPTYFAVGGLSLS